MQCLTTITLSNRLINTFRSTKSSYLRSIGLLGNKGLLFILSLILGYSFISTYKSEKIKKRIEDQIEKELWNPLLNFQYSSYQIACEANPLMSESKKIRSYLLRDINWYSLKKSYWYDCFFSEVSPILCLSSLVFFNYFFWIVTFTDNRILYWLLKSSLILINFFFFTGLMFIFRSEPILIKQLQKWKKYQTHSAWGSSRFFNTNILPFPNYSSKTILIKSLIKVMEMINKDIMKTINQGAIKRKDNQQVELYLKECKKGYLQMEDKDFCSLAVKDKEHIKKIVKTAKEMTESINNKTEEENNRRELNDENLLKILRVEMIIYEKIKENYTLQKKGEGNFDKEYEDKHKRYDKYLEAINFIEMNYLTSSVSEILKSINKIQNDYVWELQNFEEILDDSFLPLKYFFRQTKVKENDEILLKGSVEDLWTIYQFFLIKNGIIKESNFGFGDITRYLFYEINENINNRQRFSNLASPLYHFSIPDMISIKNNILWEKKNYLYSLKEK